MSGARAKQPAIPAAPKPKPRRPAEQVAPVLIPSAEIPKVCLSELQAARRAGGLECPHCGCRHFNVLHTYRAGDGIRRRRACRNCGWETTTREAPLGH